MRRILPTLVLLLGLCLCGGAQTVKDSSYRTAAYIKSDGTVQDGNYRTIGHVKGVDWKYSAALLFFFGAFK